MRFELSKLHKMKFLFSAICLPFVASMLLTTCTKQSPTVTTVQLLDSVPTLALKDINPRILIGAPLEIPRGDAKYFGIIKSEFNTGQGLWFARWGGWLGEDVYDYKDFNTNVNWMKENDISPAMHMLLGPDNYMPEWLINETWKKSKLDSLLRGMIYSIMDANDNKTKVEVWDVANELFDDDGTYRTNMIWLKMGWEADSSELTGDDKINKKHPLFIRKAFQYCRDKTDKKLEIRDFNIETDNPAHFNYRKNLAIYQLIKHMLNTKIPIDALGIQGHMTVDSSNWALDNNALHNTVKKFKDLGIDVYITELDFRTSTLTWSPAVAEKQKQEYYNYVKQAIEGGATRLNFWGIQDDFDPYWLLNEHPLLWDAKLDKKPAYFGVKAALQGTK
jgi:GH35 family endo-1,4-beta-xylanase